MSSLTLLLLFLHFSTSPSYASSPLLAPPINQTIYNITKTLCWGCWAEAVQFLYAHNVVRATHWELPLAWDPTLESYARWWATQRKGDCRLLHSFPDGGFQLGENIFWGSGSGWGPLDAVRNWAGEERDYSYAANACAPGRICGHYTQMVWKDTRRLGCSRVVCDGGGVFMTCNYYPPGNYIGEKPY